MGWWDVLAAPSTYSVNMNRNETLDMTDQYAPEQGPHREHLVPVVNNDTGLGTASLVLGIASILAGWLVIAPVIGLVLGVKSRRREPMAQGRAAWGIALNGICLAIWVVLAVLMIAGIVLGGWTAVLNTN